MDPAPMPRNPVRFAPDGGDYAAAALVPRARKPKAAAAKSKSKLATGVQPSTAREELRRTPSNDDNSLSSNKTSSFDGNNLPAPNSTEASSNNFLTQETESKWLNLVHDRTLKLRCFAQHLTLCDVRGTACASLVCGDISGALVVYSGYTRPQHIPLPDIPSAVCSLYTDTNVKRTPVLAVACNDCVLFYKNLRALFRFRVPCVAPASELEEQLWRQARATPAEDVDVAALHDMLTALAEKLTLRQLTPLSQQFLTMHGPNEEKTLEEVRKDFFRQNRATIIGRPDIITTMTTCKRESNTAPDAVSCLVFGTEHKFLYVLDAARYSVLNKRILPASAVLLHCHGLYDVDYRIIVSCRDACVYVFRNNAESYTTQIPLCCPIVGIARLGKEVVLACLDSSLRAYRKDQLQWKFYFDDGNVYPVCLLSVEFEAYSNVTVVLVALSNRQVRMYAPSHGGEQCGVLIDSFLAPDVVVAMCYGKFAREDGSLLMILQNGNLFIRVLKRTAKILPSSSMSSELAVLEQQTKQSRKLQRDAHLHLALPLVSKLFLDQSFRERQEPARMYSAFYADMFELKLQVQQNFMRAIGGGQNFMPISKRIGVDLHYEILGAGPFYQLLLQITNSNTNAASIDENSQRDKMITGLIAFVEPEGDADGDADGVELFETDRHWHYLPPLAVNDTVELKLMLKVSRFGVPQQVTVYLLLEKPAEDDEKEGKSDAENENDEQDEEGDLVPTTTTVIFKRQIELPVCEGDLLESL